MKRMALVELEHWKTSPNRKPLLIRGALQVGKKYLVRQLGAQFEHFVEINLEYHQKIKKIFEYDLDPPAKTRGSGLATSMVISSGSLSSDKEIYGVGLRDRQAKSTLISCLH